MTPDTTIAVRNPADLVDATPYVIGFHPTESLVVLGLSGNRVFFGARYDLPPPGGDDIVQLGAVISAQRARCVAVLAYGPPATVDPVVRRALAVFDAFRVRVLEALRVHDGRWWSYFCAEPGCCPAEGTPFDTATSVIAAEATYRGQVALPSRQALVALVAPVEGQPRAAMLAATERARSALDGLLTDDAHSARAIRRAGRLAVREAEKRYRAGRALTDDEVAWLGVLLLEPDVHEYTLGRIGDEEWRLALWTDVLRRVQPLYVPAVGCVLSYLAWRAGQGALARVAVDRALRVEPQHRMAALLDEVLGMGIGPHALSALDTPPRMGVALRHENPATQRPHDPRPKGSEGLRREGSDGPRREGSDGPRREGSDGPRREGSDGPRREGSDELPCEGSNELLGQESDELLGEKRDELRGEASGELRRDRPDGLHREDAEGLRREESGGLPGEESEGPRRAGPDEPSREGWHELRRQISDGLRRTSSDGLRGEASGGLRRGKSDDLCREGSGDSSREGSDGLRREEPSDLRREESDEGLAGGRPAAPSNPEASGPPRRKRRLRRVLRRRSK
ncbi:DUF4192 family protein [Actinoplanes sp. NPDC051411]|uniref:DUF4192 domain-containing protein n=1 Tax=Actinoplanes sp. NPDC051411 TaxID=3155522 RepID=UPI0034386413